ncbi:MAG: hypothetical protein M1816_001567 [Peltula sp. TS41687]|nr:MAG: hypothetical protein M1816_001567 [Peltula sp. TS41687]
MPVHEELQSLLRFLTQDAKLPLAKAMGNVKELQKAGLSSAASIAKSDAKSLQKIFEDEKLSKQILNAAKRISKKRASADDPSTVPSPSKRKRSYVDPESSGGLSSVTEEAVLLPEAVRDEEAISKTILYANRAPLVLAFAVTLLEYTMPEQPLSSRLSLAQAVVSLNSRSKAVSLGLASGKSAEEEGWGMGQPVVKIMGREVRVLKRWGYQLNNTGEEKSHDVVSDIKDQDKLVSNNDSKIANITIDTEPAMWGLDLEALRSSNGARPTRSDTGGLPIYTPQSARDYLYKSFASPPMSTTSAGDQSKSKSKSSARALEEKERNLGLLLGALHLLYTSWSSVLSKDELDRRAWVWYVQVRPEVQTGVAGWGAKGQIKLQDILDLRRKK